MTLLADFIVDLVELQSKNIRQLSQQFKDSHIANQMDSNVDASTNTIYDDVLEGSDFEQYASSWFTQVYVLCKRTILNNLRNPYLLRTQYVMIITLSGNFVQNYVLINPSSYRSDLLQTLSGSTRSSRSSWIFVFLDCFIIFQRYEFH